MSSWRSRRSAAGPADGAERGGEDAGQVTCERTFGVGGVEGSAVGPQLVGVEVADRVGERGGEEGFIEARY